MMKILRFALPAETGTEKAFLGELMQSARWLGWEMPAQAKTEVSPQPASRQEAGHFPPVSVHGEPA
jgi:hypothetical protein